MQKYTGQSFYEINEMYLDDFLRFLHDAIVYHCSQTEQGNEYLEKCYILEQTKPDRQSLRDRFGK